MQNIYKAVIYAFSLPVLIALLISISLSIGGCAYEEGDFEAQASFDLMTTTEKSLYDAVENVWTSRYLVNVRKAVRNRRTKPVENFLPFYDIKSTIRTNNDVTLIVLSIWEDSARLRYNNSKWSSIDPVWYNKLVAEINKGPIDKSVQKVTQDRGKSQEKSDRSALIKEPVDKTSDKHAARRSEMPSETLIDGSEYFDLYFLIKKCPRAIEMYNAIVDGEKRPLTKGDVELINKEAAYCLAKATRDTL